ncbi:hypothetical protein [Candidatus Magnetaquicoccus inordinatus]|uniref:hypothetical protein n=1 Tax=Candidatus Magnetaquicoccus inordinatus TaxID=2496818 RepID=UPI00102BDFA6|nr:hypothetical protein [Candidatus Magnetaquicoccus inordinatus]
MVTSGSGIWSGANHADFFISVVLVVLIGRIKHLHCRSLWSAALVNFVGVVFHELAHYVIALILGGQPKRFSVWPKRTAEGFLFGQVVCARINAFNALPIGIAPLSLLPLAWLIHRKFYLYLQPTPWNYAVYLFLMVVVIENALPSSADWRLVRQFPVGLFGWIAVLTSGVLAWQRHLL